MYKVEVDGHTIHDPRDENFILPYAKVDLELNKTGSFEFDITSKNPGYTYVDPMKSVISVYDDGKLIFRGRSTTKESDFYNTGTLKCEGELSYLIDTILRPRSSAFHNQTNRYVFQEILNEHNSQVEEEKQFLPGTIDVDSETISQLSFNYEKPLDFINANLIEKYGGYLRIRYADGKRYLDWVKQYGKTSKQPIRFGYNLLDLKKTLTSTDVCTVVVPVGGSDKKVTVKNAVVNGNIYGKDYIQNDEAVSYFGKIIKVQEFSDIQEPTKLYTEGKKWLEENMKSSLTVELTALDLHMIDLNIDDFKLGDLVPVISIPHEIVFNDDLPVIEKYSYDLTDPSKNTITVGKTLKVFTERKDKEIYERVQEVKGKFEGYVVTNDGKIEEITEDIQEYKALVLQDFTAVNGKIDNLSGDFLNFKTGEFENLKASMLTADNLDAKIAEIGVLTTETADIRYAAIKDLEAANAKIGALEAGQIKTEYLDAHYAQIDLANIKDGSITTAMIGIGVVGTAQIADGSITDAKIVGLTANKITAGTLDAGTIEVINLNAANITVGTINGQQIAPGAIDVAQLSSGVNSSINNANSNANQALQDASDAMNKATQASNEAGAAQATADGKNTVYYQSAAPTGAKKNDIWFNTSKDNQMAIYDGSKWVVEQFGADAIEDGIISADKIASDVNTKINEAFDNAGTAITDSANAVETADSAKSAATTANNNATSALNKANSSVQSITMHYLATASASGVTTSTSGWTMTVQSVTSTKKYLWTYYTVTTASGSTTNSTPVISGVYGDTGAKGDTGATGVAGATGATGATGTGVSSVIPLYYINSSTTAPSAPTSAVTSTSTGTGVWTKSIPTYVSGYTYFTCTQTLYSNGTYKWSTVVADNALTSANSTATTAKSTADTAKTTADSALTKANAASTAASTAQTTADGKNTVFYQTSAPATTGRKTNDIWFDTDDGNKMYYYNGSAWTAKQFGTSAIASLSITNALIADGTIQNAKIANLDAAKITTGYLSADRIAAASLTANKLAAKTITAVSGVLADACILTANIADLAVSSGKIANAAIGTAKIADLAVTNAKLANLSVTNAKIADATIENAKIKNVDAAKITTGTLDADRIGANTITAAKMASGAITTDKLAANAVTATKIASRTITADKIVAGAITSNEIAAKTITANNIAANTITAASGVIADAAITNAMIASLDAEKITTGTLSADRIDVNGIFAKDITATGTITGANLVGATGSFSGSITANSGTIGDLTLSNGILTGTGTLKVDDETSLKYTTTISKQGVQINSYDVNNTSDKYEAFVQPDHIKFSAPDVEAELGANGLVCAYTDAAGIYNSSKIMPEFIQLNYYNRTEESLYLNCSAGGLVIDMIDSQLQFSTDGLKLTGSTSANATITCTDVKANGWIYCNQYHFPASGSNNYISCGNYNNTYNNYYYAQGYHAFYCGNNGIVYINNEGIQMNSHGIKVSDQNGLYSNTMSNYIIRYYVASSTKCTAVGNNSYATRIYGSSVWANKAVSTSDERLKKDFNSLDNILDVFMELEPVSFKWKQDYEDGDNLIHFGLKAQQVEKAFKKYGYNTDKYSVIGNFGGYMGICYDDLFMMTMCATQKNTKELMYQSGKIDLHETIIQDLQNRIYQLETQLKELRQAVA